jgi:Ca2+-binding RTX toxin-like protein
MRRTLTGTEGRRGIGALRRRSIGAIAVAAVVVGTASGALVQSATAATAPVGNGLVVTAGDLSFILKQIKIAERHAETATPADPCGTLVGPGPDQIPDVLTSYGLRTVDGSCNNLVPGREKFAAADVPFPRLTRPVFREAEGSPPGFPPQAASSYTQKKGFVYDSQPRVISNLIVDQTSTNPAAIQAAGFPVRTQGNPGLFPCTTDPVPPDGSGAPGIPAGCVASHHTLFIPNVTTDVGLSPPYNSLFTFFGQFFDHGVDQTVKSGGTVFVPLKADDPLITLGPDGVAGSGDEVPPSQAFMVLTRAQNQPGPDGILGDRSPTTVGGACTALNTPVGCDESFDDVQDANNTDTPWVDQSQTYTSHASHQVFLREYNSVAGKPVSTGKFLGGLGAGLTYPGSPDGTDGISTWASTKLQAATKLGLQLVDTDVTNIPMLATDPYGNFIPGPARGLPQYVTTTGLVEGDLTTPVPVPANVLHFDTPFLTDIAHNADPSAADLDHNPATPPTFPVPDTDTTPSADFANQPAGTYDDEMLNAHFTCGDGRCNENIALSTIHQIFHSEHNRLVDDITTTLNQPGNAALLADFQAAHPFGAKSDIGFGFGGRLFQAARFVTEMEYQHLVFEEFARKVQPAVRPFHLYNPDANPAVEAEFAHAVYRFGHSMLDDDVARTTTVKADGTQGPAVDNSVPLLTAFLNPPEFFNNSVDPDVGNRVYTPKQAAGAVVMGSSDQVGNELDEFVVETLRNNLLGLPLDLPTLNMTRARDAGIPPLNDVRRQIFAETNDGQLAPYTSWSDFGQHLKHPESLINFVAAYGTHTSITSATTLAAKRDAARAIVNPTVTDVPPADAADFMFGTGAYVDDPATGKTTTGLDSVDLWVGGLAEVTNLFGGLLGSTFNYVFQTQLETLQDFDRLYYLARTPGMNLRTQLEGNSFSELIQRNTDGTNTLKADAFATADCKFQLANITGPATSLDPDGIPNSGDENFLLGAGTVNNDPTTTDCSENRLLLRQPNGTIQYRQFNTVDPSGINGQSVYNGTPGVDRIFGGNDNDTFWGGAGNDVIEGNGGDDVALGGDGNDIITDLGGADVPKGGPGNDAIDGGIGDDIPMGNEGQDFINGGANDNESFAGEGNDFIIAGQGADAVFGDGGDDWIEGGSGQDLLQGDHGAPFFDDPAESKPGNDIFVGQVGENDYDAEGGDDVMAQNAAVDRNAGAGGFDWAFHQYNTVAADDDMMINNNLGGLPIQVIVNRDRWQETEADSGGPRNDVFKGTDGVLGAPKFISGGGFSGCDAVDAAGLARIKGFDQLLPPIGTWTTDAAVVAGLSVSGVCPLTGPVWGDGDVLIGGPGSDTFTGRTGDEIIDGDKFLTTAISVRTNPADPATETGRTDLMENRATSGNFGPGTTPTMTLQQAVFAGLVDPGNLVAVREIVTPTVTAPDCGAATPLNCDTAVFSGPRSQYTIAAGTVPGTTLVTDNNSVAAAPGAPPTGDGTDTVSNVEQLRFTDQTVSIVPVPVASVTPTSVAFGNQRVGTTGLQTVTLTNTGNANLVVSGVAVAGDPSFGTTSTCSVVPAGGTCVINLSFTPATTGAKAGTLTITHNAAGSPTVVNLTGTGTAPVASLSVTALAFGNQVTNTTSAARAITVTNTGTAPLTVGAVTLTGTDAALFSIATNTCTVPVAPAGACTIGVTFRPTTTGAKTASVSITHDAAGSPSTVSLTGTGTALIVLTPSSLTFGAQNVGTVSAIQTTVLSNGGTVPVTTSAVTLGGTDASQFQVTVPAGCVRTRAAGLAFCTISVRFRPTTPGTKTATITVTSVNGGTVVANLTGSGTPVATIATPANLAFGRRPLNSSTTTTLTVTNTGTANLTLNTVNPLVVSGAAYSATVGTCTGPLAPGGTCQLNVTFHPTVAGNPITGTLTINSNASNNPRTVNLTGRAP